MSRVLVVDDDPRILRTLEINLQARNFDVVLARSGEEALRAVASSHPDVVILDLGLPGLDGLDVVQGIRGWSSVPILILSGRDNEATKVQALDLGADDYLTKPFGMDELFARLRASLRRSVVTDEKPMVVTPDFVIDFASKQITRQGEPIKLTPTQWHIVEMLVRNNGRLVTYDQLLQEVWGPGYGKETNYLRVFMTQIRQKLEPDHSRPQYFITEPGIGFRFESPEENSSEVADHKD